jgi:hypothetical protein
MRLILRASFPAGKRDLAETRKSLQIRVLDSRYGHYYDSRNLVLLMVQVLCT